MLMFEASCRSHRFEIALGACNFIASLSVSAGLFLFIGKY
jgi:hypothetical protein